ncbi:hypothetical protein [Streptomyces sp. NPDC002845]
MNSMSRTIMLAASSLAAPLAFLSVAAAPAHAAPAEPLVRTGDVSVLTGDFDILEDVLEHISMTRGNGTTTHQLYDSRGTAAPE